MPVGAGAPGTGMKTSPPRVLQLWPPAAKLGIWPGVCASAPASRLVARTAVPTPNNIEANLDMVCSIPATRVTRLFSHVLLTLHRRGDTHHTSASPTLRQNEADGTSQIVFRNVEGSRRGACRDLVFEGR